MIKDQEIPTLINYNIRNPKQWVYECFNNPKSRDENYKEILYICNREYSVHAHHVNIDVRENVPEGIAIIFHTKPLGSGSVHAISDIFKLF